MIWSGRNNTIGGTGAGAGNAISGNRFQGVIVEGATATGNAILGNAVSGNGTLGIDLGNTGVTANDGVEIFKSDNDGSGYGEGQAYLGYLTSDANGNFSGNLTVSGLTVGDKITGTATDGSNNTSEFGANFTVTPPTADLALTKTDNPDPAASGGDLLYTLLITNNGPNTATGVTLTDVLPASVTFQSATPSQGSCY